MVTRDTIRNLKPGNRLEIRCDNVGEFNSAYHTAYQTRRELGLTKEVMTISQSAPDCLVVVEYRKGGEA